MVLYVCLCVHVSTSVCACFFFFLGSVFRRNPVIPTSRSFSKCVFFFRFAVAVKWCGLLFVSLFV